MQSLAPVSVACPTGGEPIRKKSCGRASLATLAPHSQQESSLVVVPLGETLGHLGPGGFEGLLLLPGCPGLPSGTAFRSGGALPQKAEVPPPLLLQGRNLRFLPRAPSSLTLR